MNCTVLMVLQEDEKDIDPISGSLFYYFFYTPVIFPPINLCSATMAPHFADVQIIMTVTH